MSALDLRIATCVALPEPDVDQAPLAAALGAAGLSAARVGWDDPAADWDAPIPTLVRSTWNYPAAPAAFLAWVDRASAAAPMLNPPDVVRGNVHKRYLLELAARGVPVVPTVLVERGQTCELAALAAPGVVIKPAIGAASLATRRFAPGDPAALAHLAAITAERAALVQPYAPRSRATASARWSGSTASCRTPSASGRDSPATTSRSMVRSRSPMTSARSPRPRSPRSPAASCTAGSTSRATPPASRW